MPCKESQMDNTQLVTLAALEHHPARVEMLRRHVMAVDTVEYATACATVDQMTRANHQGRVFLALPYQIGIGMGLVSAAGSLPMVFDIHTALWFNEIFVTTEVPPAEDLETILETGSWTWNWMEPPLGTISFVLLCLQFARAQMQHLGIQPYTGLLKKWRGRQLADQFPQYDAKLVKAFSETSPLWNNQA